MKIENPRLILATMVATAGLIAVLGALAGALVLYSGWYNVGATVQHWQPVYTLLERGMHNSVRHHARGIQTPDLAAPQRISHGATLYRAHCVQCHGAPGIAPAAIGMGVPDERRRAVGSGRLPRPVARLVTAG